MSIVIDTLNCGEGTIGTYFNGCNISLKDVVKVFLKKKSLKISLADGNFDLEARAEYIKSGELIPLNDLLNFTDNPQKNNVQTFTNKIKKTVSQGLYDFSLDFEESTCLSNAFHKIAKQNGWELLILDSEDKLFFDNKGGFLNGFSISDISVNNTTFNDGAAKISMLTLDIQLDQNGTAGFNKRRSFIVDDTLVDVNGIQDVTILKLSQASAAIKVQLVSGCDNSSTVSGLASKFRVRKASDNSVVASVATEVNGEYNIPIASANGDYLIDLYDSADSSTVVDILDEAFYKSNVLQASFP
ncbi:hypothetical protein [Epilithonimonas caeni]|uniref:hypothetical protein n=1 Tax=Epilithonimonas caeni TaxID=365343 RepID=UPI0003FE488B|nr:hypothetical protein [Epilithonimonas caeni]